MTKSEWINNLKSDLPASIVVFFVALPLCLGIALASGAPLFSGIIAGIVGGIVIGAASGSQLGVSGPAAGLAVIVFTAIASLGSWQAFSLAVMLAGIIQLVMGFAKAGFIASFFPSSVIKGMLTGIGLLIIMKQFPHLLGFSASGADSRGFTPDGIAALITPGAVIIGVISIGLLVLWEQVLAKKHSIFKLIQGPIAVVVFGIVINLLYGNGFFGLALAENQVVRLPVSGNLIEFFSHFTLPDFTQISNAEVWKVAMVLALVASLETLLCVEATDKLDPQKRVTPTNRELKAQGFGNVVSGLIGGLPLTQVIVRSAANISFGAKTKSSTIMHGVFLFVSAATGAALMNKIPLASLAAVLIMVGYKLAQPKLFKEMFLLGREQFVPFTATVIGIVTTDLLKGIIIGLIFGVYYTLKHSYRNSHHMKDVITNEEGREVHHLVLAQEVSFFNKANVKAALDAIPRNSKVIIDCTQSKSIAYDVIELILNFRAKAQSLNISVETINFIEPEALRLKAKNENSIASAGSCTSVPASKV